MYQKIELVKIQIERSHHIYIIKNFHHHEDLLYSAGSPTQRSVVTSMGRKSKKEWLYVHT